MSTESTPAPERNANAPAAAPSKLGIWWQHHLHSVVFSLGRAFRKPWATLLTVMVMALALALPLGLSIALDNLKHFAGSVQQSRDINVFLKADVDGREVLDLSMGFGAMLVGHLNPTVVAAVGKALLMQMSESEAARILRRAQLRQRLDADGSH